MLTTMPLHFMQVLQLPPWLLKILEGMRRRDILHHKDFYLASTTTDPVSGLTTWRWNKSGTFSSASAYRVISDPGVWSTRHTVLWRIKAPPRVKVFLWLLTADRLLTQTNLMRRGWPSIQACQGCSNNAVEDTNHLFVHCELAQQLWSRIVIHYTLPPISFRDEITDFWQDNRAIPNWDLIWAATSWTIWKERNARIFSAIRTSPDRLLPHICLAVQNWNNMA
ncbi:hypothetical protein LUZ61_008059 [Rhynchospora tenuis]|uniref:Reverse transcriptase zinc-binding domain-containing protein n=1 Tax=Rhynchospora tenuis TaxID=198213 RepID=A0AAD5ZUU8_9POAL|nr:hypothetical protein LUZ61_008059 [Rhynchospora tenuis]